MDFSYEAMETATTTRHAWRRGPRDERARRRAFRLVSITCITALSLVALACLVALLVDPFHHPQVRFLSLTGADLSGNVDGFFGQPGVLFPGDEQAALARVQRHVFPASGRRAAIAIDRWKSPNDVRSLGLKLVEAGLAPTDVAIVQIVAHGVSEAGDAKLCWSFGRPAAEPGRIRLADVLQQLRDSTSAKKLLILDAGNVDYLPHEGMIANEFPLLLKKLVEETHDRSLWVLCSHDV
ncbi:MAG TPA: hypothetical protein VKU82_14375, partial [Planctomycetaceae bacterium]|nr:hypothetical protein [Planctomycetaceae bacterium]